MLKRLHWVGPVIGVALVLLVAGLLALAVFGSDTILAKVGIWTGILGFALAALGVAVPLVRRTGGREATPAELDEDARALAEAVRIAEVRNRRRLVGGDEPARLRIATAGRGKAHLPLDVDSGGGDGEEGLLVRLRELLRFSGTDLARVGDGDGGQADPGRDAMDLTQVADHFRTLSLPRMVVLGPPGAGKTVLLTAFVVQYLRTAQERDPIPVRAYLAGYDPETQELAPWLAEWIASQYRITLPRARRLVGTGRILPVLDGLDEMDRDPGSPDRAVAALRRIDAHIAGPELGVVLACREYEWRRIGAGVAGANIIGIHPLDADTIRQYARARLAERDLGDDAWRPVVSRVAQEPDGALAKVLGRPLWLYLAIRVYGAVPEPLLRTAHDEAELRQHLLAEFIPTATRVPGKSGSEAVEGQARAWLREVACFLEHSGRSEAKAAEIFPDRLWPVAGKRVIRLLHLALFGLLLLGSLGLGVPAITIFVEALMADMRGPLEVVLLVVLALVVAILLLARTLVVSIKPSMIGKPRLRGFRERLLSARPTRTWFRGELQSLVTELRRPAVVKAVIGIFIVAGVTGVVMEAALQALYVIFVSTLFLAFFHLAIGLISIGMKVLRSMTGAIVDVVPRTPRRPYDILRFDRATGVIVASSVAVTGAVIDGAPNATSIAALTLLATGAFVLVAGVAVRYGLAVTVLAATGRGPLRLRRFLEWCVEAGLLREAGTAYQFRHIELQRWLAARPSSGGSSGAPADH